jgi:hypothetical protein
MSNIFAASDAIMAPYSTAKLTMTVSQILLSNKTDGTCCQAKTDWKIANNGGTARPCQLLTPSIQRRCQSQPYRPALRPRHRRAVRLSSPMSLMRTFPALVSSSGTGRFGRLSTWRRRNIAPARLEFARISGNNRHEVLIAATPAAISSDCTRRLRDFHAVFCPGRETCLAFAIPKPGFPLLLPARAYSRMPEPVPMSHPRP